MGAHFEIKSDVKIVLRNSILFVTGAALCALLLSSLTGCKNVLSESAQKTTDPALLFSAQQSLDAGDFTAAIEAILAMTSTGRSTHEAKALLGSAYAGRCGLDLISLADKLSNLGSSTLMEMLLANFVSATAADVTDCQDAETALLGISAPNADEKVLLAFVEFAKIGAILANKGDGNTDGSVGPGFDPCAHAPLTDALAGHVGTGITIAAASLSGTSIGSGTMALITTLCGTIDAQIQILDPSYTGGFCDKTDATAWSANELRAIRSVINANEIGLKTCNNTVSNCICGP